MFECQVITSRGGRFLEAPVAGSQQLSNDGMLVILAAGDRTVYEDCSSCFQAMGKTSFFLGMSVYGCSSGRRSLCTVRYNSFIKD